MPTSAKAEVLSVVAGMKPDLIERRVLDMKALARNVSKCHENINTHMTYRYAECSIEMGKANTRMLISIAYGEINQVFVPKIT